MNKPLTDLSTLDFYLSGQSDDEYRRTKRQLEVLEVSAMPLLSWDIFMQEFHQRAANNLKQGEMEMVLSFAKKYKWSNDLVAAFSENDYEALIITDKSQKILWVNDGFTAMTGYAKKDAINKSPRFLQGEKTSVETKKRIRAKLAKDLPFQEVIINHRKDNSTYKCQVKIIPLVGEETTHYIAFEKKVG